MCAVFIGPSQKIIETAPTRGLCASTSGIAEQRVLLNKAELRLQAQAWKGAQETLGVKTGYRMHEHDFMDGKNNTPKTLNNIFICA